MQSTDMDTCKPTLISHERRKGDVSVSGWEGSNLLVLSIISKQSYLPNVFSETSKHEITLSPMY